MILLRFTRQDPTHSPTSSKDPAGAFQFPDNLFFYGKDPAGAIQFSENFFFFFCGNDFLKSEPIPFPFGNVIISQDLFKCFRHGFIQYNFTDKVRNCKRHVPASCAYFSNIFAFSVQKF